LERPLNPLQLNALRQRPWHLPCS